MKFHEKLYSLRKKAGMTQLDLAEKLGVSRQAVSRWEMGTAMPEIENLIAMSDLFSVSLDYMLKEKQDTLSAPAEKTREDITAQVKQMKPLEQAAFYLVVLAVSMVSIFLIIFLLDSGLFGLLFLILVPVAVVKLAKMEWKSK